MFRVFYAIDLPLSGDEVGVGVLQATGQAFHYLDRLPNTTAPLSDIQSFLQYSNEYSIPDVLKSLRFAGMHPPLYYIILHGILKFYDNDMMTLRIFSILLSLISTLLIYQLGKIIFDNHTGLLAALLFAISGYGLIYGTLVRPYPLAMVLALLSTLLIVKMNKGDKIHLKNLNLYVYGFTILLGLYTIYHFFFVAVFHCIYLLLNLKKLKQHLLPALAISALIFIGYLPWLNAMADQMKVVSASQFYFHGPFKPIVIVENILWIHLNTIRWLSIDPLMVRIIVKLILGSTLLVPIFAGCLFIIRKKINLRFFIAIAASFLVYACAEALMNMNTLEDLHLLFFAIPIMCIILAKGVAHFPNRFKFRTILITLLLTLFTGNSLAAITSHPKRRGEQYIEIFSNTMNFSYSQNSKNLLLIDTTQRRHLFSLAHAIQNPMDIKIIKQNKLNSSFIDKTQFDPYAMIFFVNLYVDYATKSHISEQKVVWLTEQLLQKNFQLMDRIVLGVSSNGSPLDKMLIFKRIESKSNL